MYTFWINENILFLTHFTYINENDMVCSQINGMKTSTIASVCWFDANFQGSTFLTGGERETTVILWKFLLFCFFTSFYFQFWISMLLIRLWFCCFSFIARFTHFKWCSVVIVRLMVMTTILSSSLSSSWKIIKSNQNVSRSSV